MSKPVKKVDLKTLSDAELVAQIKATGASGLFGELYRRYSERVKKKCRSLVRNASVVDDLVQDIFMKAFQNLSKFRSDSTFSTWLFAITYTYCIEYLRRNKRIRFGEWEENLDLPDEVEDEDVKQILELRQERVILLLEMLKPEDKVILLMKYHEGLRLKTIMEVLKISSESATKMKINRAKKRLVGLYNELFAE